MSASIRDRLKMCLSNVRIFCLLMYLGKRSPAVFDCQEFRSSRRCMMLDSLLCMELLSSQDIYGRRRMPDALQGTLDLLILKSLERAPNHGFGIALHIQTVSDGLLRVEEGSLYPALHRL